MIPVVTIEAYTENEEVLTVETIEEGEMTQAEELDLLAACVEAEAGNQSSLGKRLVVDVILNRVEHPAFPNNIHDVIYQPGQFAVVANGAIDRVIPSEDTWRAIFAEMSGILIDDNIIYFQTGSYGYGEPWEHVGAHYFSK